MSKSFRWKGPGVFTDFINGKAFQAGEGQIVHEHTVAPEKLAQWVKDGIAEFVNVVENIADRIGGQKPDDEDTKRLQAAHDQVNATLRIKVLGELRLLLLDRAFTDAERSDAERDIETTGIEDLQRALESTQAEHKRRLSIASTPATPPAPPAPPEPSTGADDSDRLSEEDMERITNPDAVASQPPAPDGAGPK